MTLNQKIRDYLPYCKLCLIYGKCDGPDIVKNPDDHLLGDWEGTEKTSCRKFVGTKPAGKLSLLRFEDKAVMKV